MRSKKLHAKNMGNPRWKTRHDLLDHVDIGGAYAVFLRQLRSRDTLGPLGQNVRTHLLGLRSGAAPALGAAARSAAGLFQMRGIEHLLRRRDDPVEVSNLSFGK